MYRSKLEEKVANVIPDWDYEGRNLEYTSYHKYVPDFHKSNYVIEVKGRFRTYSEASKYIAVRDSNPTIRFIFLFSDPAKAMPGARKRKDGTRLSMGEWALKNDFEYTTIEELGEWLSTNT